MTDIVTETQQQRQHRAAPTQLRPRGRALTFFDLADELALRTTILESPPRPRCLDCPGRLSGPMHAVRHAARTGHAVAIESHTRIVVGDLDATERALFS